MWIGEVQSADSLGGTCQRHEESQINQPRMEVVVQRLKKPFIVSLSSGANSRVKHGVWTAIYSLVVRTGLRCPLCGVLSRLETQAPPNNIELFLDGGNGD